MSNKWIVFWYCVSDGHFYAHRVKDPWAMLSNAAWYLAHNYRSTRSYQDRGLLLPEQEEALNILETHRYALLHSTAYYVV